VLRYAAHLGYRKPDEPLVGPPGNPLASVALAGRLGFDGMQFAHAMVARPQLRQAVALAMREAGLTCGCMIYAPVQEAIKPYWTTTGATARIGLMENVDSAVAVATQIGSKCIAILSGMANGVPGLRQRAACAENLRYAADRAAAAGVTLGIEPISPRRLPNMLFQHLEDAVTVIAAVGNPSLGLIFDTAHVHDVDGAVPANFAAVIDHVSVLQLADAPDRTEPGTGEIDFAALLQCAADAGHSGLIELEHGWAAEPRPAQLLAELRAQGCKVDERAPEPNQSSTDGSFPTPCARVY